MEEQKDYSVDDLLNMSEEDFEALATDTVKCTGCGMTPCICDSAEATTEAPTDNDPEPGGEEDLEDYGTNTETDEGANESTGKTFTQEEVNTIIKKRLAKEKGKAPDDPLYSFAMEIVSESGMAPEDFIAQARAGRAKNREAYETKKASMEGVSPEVYKELQEARQIKSQHAEDQRRRQGVTEFQAEFPDVSLDDVPDDIVQKFFDNGGSLVDLYARHAVKQLRSQKPDTTKQAPGSVSSKGAAKKTLTMKDLEGKDKQFFMDNLDEIEKLYGDKQKRGGY